VLLSPAFNHEGREGREGHEALIASILPGTIPARVPENERVAAVFPKQNICPVRPAHDMW
jgi:hypothetical protein